MSVSKKARDAAMRMIIDAYREKKTSYSIGPNYIRHKGLPDNADADETIEVLKSMGLIDYTKERDGSIYDIIPSESGLSYFEREADDKAKRKEKHIHNWKLAIFSALFGALASEPLWTGIRFLASIIRA